MYGAYNYVVIVEQATNRVHAVVQGHGHKVTALSASACGQVVVSGSKDRSVVAWNLERRCVLRKRTKLPAEVAALCTLPHTESTAVLALTSGALVSWLWSEGAPLPNFALAHPL